MSNNLENFISQNKEAFNTATPSNDVLKLLQKNILALQQKQQKKTSIIRFLKFVSAACILVLAGVGIYNFNNSKSVDVATNSIHVNEISNIVKNVENLPVEDLNKSTGVNKETLTSTLINQNEFVKNKYIIQLQNMDAPSKRYVAATEIVNSKQIDKEVVDALTACLNNDPNTNVRLAALESLSIFYKEPLVKKRLIESLNKQTDPIVKMTLIDVLTKLRANNLQKELEKIINDINAPKPVKDQANQSIHTLSL